MCEKICYSNFRILYFVIIKLFSLYIQCGYVQLLRDNNVSLIKVKCDISLRNINKIAKRFIENNISTKISLVSGDNEVEFATHAYSVLVWYFVLI